jgi:hypothetical protein
MTVIKLDSSGLGFAARCEARLCLAVEFSKLSGWAPGSGLWPIPLGQSPNQGLSPIYKRNGYGGAEPRLTSGGKAGVDGVKSQDRLLIFKAVSHKTAKPEWMESVSRSLDFKTVSHIRPA